ncbi:TetR/AcrR family transcriptional regulator [Pseudomonas orientalis]|uniref:TetR/AcrR family transcriptional regulator n=1 Tax=Pseudomonas orientalis TaxID=76758 RepID=UPI0015E7AF22|nr:TetR/AcrR family transcriptional regulator [Pseudomonas orientalis]MBA1431905.1 TetR/AcrR family transcriptional regulator [Pseudomonas orientalis]UOB21857.1 TetR/AcrR family transcriptional regulator [Pseudomonas orientalis]
MSSEQSPAPRRRLSREERLHQLLETAWQLVREEGTDALTLGRLAELAGVTKPVVYDHFATRSGLLAALYEDFDGRQNQVFVDAIEASSATLEDRAWVIASSYVDCVLLQGREIPGVTAALSGSPELEALKCKYEAIFLDKCRDALAPFAPGGRLSQAGLRAMLGAAEALSHAAASAEISREEAQQELLATILAMVKRGACGRGLAPDSSGSVN